MPSCVRLLDRGGHDTLGLRYRAREGLINWPLARHSCETLFNSRRLVKLG
jgi:hypothetical protein